ncbi:LysM peptidoglycan-binding domain-containing protein [Candidatus Formimonas warabiya]|uniref:LysM domain-containing protein n=1 Tax=Formimonas warabiya TaxID=1761012 RepID=A0A3G1KPQ0_FORW1|nr:LysM peptidoglycan-binding domain-containing protein [Candidatus Formimonas warabiya]ATW24442.1 hypothetical protein DCMF_06290 [Candidatus Formimonas warabiya]
MDTRQLVSCPGGTVYTIRRGDTFFSLAERFNTTVENIIDANPEIDPDALEVGQRICIPGAQGPVTCEGGTFYTIRSGDTLPRLATRFNTTVDAILDANPGLDPDRLRVGRRICIPAAETPATCEDGTFYTIRSGDTLPRLATRFNTTVNAILNANPGLDPDRLRVGRRICIPAAEAPVTCEDGRFYTIRSGDTLLRLADRFNTTVDAILDANPGLEPENLRVGQRICIPAAQAPVTCEGGTFYTIRSGDTLFRLADRFNTTVDAILDANPGLDPESLQVGRRICIPAAEAPSPTCPGRTYTIRSGDTLVVIAQRFGVTLQALLAANPGINPRMLRVGQVICLPTSAGGGVTCPYGNVYVVRTGDTLSAIAARYGLSLRQLLAANPQITNPNNISIGQSICIPRGMRSASDEYPAASFPYISCPFAPSFRCLYSNYYMMSFRPY